MLRIAIDEIRSVFKNIGETKNDRGLYPFEPIKSIYSEFNNVSHGENYSEENAQAVKGRIIKNWKKVRQPFLSEFERTEPSTPSTPYL